MKERPIIFTAESVRAILAGLKTQTRRLIKLTQFGPSSTPGYEWTFRDKRGLWNDLTTAKLLAWPRRSWTPYRADDLLWVKEAWCMADPEFANDGGPKYYFAATDEGVKTSGFRKDGHPRSPWISPLFMPRSASRITLRVTSVRVERVQAISDADAIAEGVEMFDNVDVGIVRHTFGAKAAFAVAWDQINAKRASWARNQWVWVVAFEVVR